MLTASQKDYSHLFDPFFFKSIYLTSPLLFTNELINQLATLIKKEPNRALQKPSTEKPGARPETIFSITAFMIKVKSPKVKILVALSIGDL